MVIFSIVFGISYISSSFIWYAGGQFGLYYYFSPLSFPLEFSVEISPLLIWPPSMTLRLNLFGIEIFKGNGFFINKSNNDFQFIFEGVTLIITVIILLINIAFVLVCLLILYIVDKRRIRKDLIKYSRTEKLYNSTNIQKRVL
jgi:hypothetical protein